MASLSSWEKWPERLRPGFSSEEAGPNILLFGTDYSINGGPGRLGRESEDPAKWDRVAGLLFILDSFHFVSLPFKASDSDSSAGHLTPLGHMVEV